MTIYFSYFLKSFLKYCKTEIKLSGKLDHSPYISRSKIFIRHRGTQREGGMGQI